MTEVEKEIVSEKIVFFGCGSWLEIVNHTELMTLESRFYYVVDNNKRGCVKVGRTSLEVLDPQILKKEKDCTIIITSSVYMYEIYLQLVSMELSDSIQCFAFPFMELITKNETSIELLNKVKNKKLTPKIPPIIHSFWFSGDEKPYSYAKCISTWGDALNGYDIREWNMDNYDWKKHPFMKRAIELKAWAFASDYARLDVLYNIGGIYMDMDIEVFRNFDDLLGNDAILSFLNHTTIDLAFVGAKKKNPLIKQLLDLYDQLELPNSKEEFSKYYQPVVIRNKLVENGIVMDGSLQQIKNATVFPKQFFMPMDTTLFKPYTIDENTYCVHYDNFGWSFSKDNKREKKIRDNNRLWDLLENRN